MKLRRKEKICVERIKVKKKKLTDEGKKVFLADFHVRTFEKAAAIINERKKNDKRNLQN